MLSANAGIGPKFRDGAWERRHRQGVSRWKKFGMGFRRKRRRRAGTGIVQPSSAGIILEASRSHLRTVVALTLNPIFSWSRTMSVTVEFRLESGS